MVVSRGQRIALAVVALAIWACIPLFVTRSLVDLLVFTGIYAIAGLGVSFLLGQCGIVSLAQSVFYGIGAYASSYLCVTHKWPIPLAMLAGILVSAAIAAALGWSILRLSGFFLALGTLALGVIGHTLFVEWSWLTGGTLGTGGIPHINIFGFVLNTPQRFYYFVGPVAVIVFALHYKLLDSRFGLAMRGMRDAPDAALALGVPTQRLKVQVFVLSAVVGSLAGSLLAHYVSFVSTDSFTVDKSIHFLLIAVLGGVNTVAGALLGSLFVTLLPNAMTRFGDIHALLFAILLVVSVIFLPKGFGGALKDWTQRLGRKT